MRPVVDNEPAGNSGEEDFTWTHTDAILTLTLEETIVWNLDKSQVGASQVSNKQILG